jgi:diguanylate cyclase (GGDEF)-like protein
VRVPADLAADLTAATTSEAAADAVVGHLARSGHDLPSVYVERGGRLRCLAQRGYWQVFDGVPPTSGVLGRGFTEGRTVVVRAVEQEADYIRAVPEVRAAVCVPLRAHGRVAGVVSVESRAEITESDVRAMEVAASALGDRLERLPRDVAAPAELLARASYALACCDSVQAILDTTTTAAAELSGLDTAAVLLLDGDAHQVAHAVGPLAAVLSGLPADGIRQLSDYVETATSSYSFGADMGDGFEAVRLLREQGVGSLAVLSLRAVNEPVGVMVLADTRPRPDLRLAVPLLEMLAATAAATIGTARVREALHASRLELEHQAGHDALTGLPNRSQVLERLRRPGDEPRAVLFVDLDGFKAVNDQHGHAVGDELLVAVGERLLGLARDGDMVSRFGGDEFVVLCHPLGELADAETVASRIVQKLAMPYRLGGVRAHLSASVGVAVFHGAVDAEALLASADRAMYAAKVGGGNAFVVTADGT